MKTDKLLLRYSEIILKGKNRGFFEDRLLGNIHAAIEPFGSFKISRLGSTFKVTAEQAIEENLIKRLQQVYGLANIMPVFPSLPTMDALTEDILTTVPFNGIKSFAVRARRVNTNIALSSRDVNYTLGDAIREKFNLKVDLDSPELTVYIEMIQKEVLFFWKKYQGACGLPVGVSGKVIVLLSGGIDSPVASSLMASRGCLPIYLHFHSVPYTKRASIDKVHELVQKLKAWNQSGQIYLVPFADLQREIVTKCPEPLRVILYRRFMMRIAEQIAKRERVVALVTGESVGQVASQTLSNMKSIEAVTGLPILRPLVGMDKNEIIARARKLGTYDISIEPDEDCCSYLMPQKPATHSRVQDLEAAERALDVQELVDQAIADIEKN
jgi:tRNA uracil 4-sulfurtransferase